MAQVLIRNVSEGLIDAYKAKARLHGTSLEQVLRDLLERNAPFSPEERTALFKRCDDARERQRKDHAPE